ncbi:hypothetical protein [Ramlibacter sp. PS4R-6]|uniref:hypothetical protein n=1 Tax=Ramlibacter sp. PS4R-6 TaxID=3133438 RepID=UPI0030AE070A
MTRTFRPFIALACLCASLLACGGGSTGEPVEAAAPTQLTLLAGSTGGPGDLDGDASVARLGSPFELDVDAQGNVLVRDGAMFRMISPSGAISTIGGPAEVPPGFRAITDPQGNTYEAGYCVVWKVTPSFERTAFAGTNSECGMEDGPRGQGRLTQVMSMATDRKGTIYVVDLYVTPGYFEDMPPRSVRVRKIAADGTITTLAGGFGFDAVDGQGLDARFSGPGTLAADGLGNLYIVDLGIRRIDAARNVTTLHLGGVLPENVLVNDIAADAAGNLYIADALGGVVSVVLPGTGTAVVLGGQPTEAVRRDGQGAAARFESVAWSALDNNGDVLVPSFGNGGLVMRRVTPDGGVTSEFYPATVPAVSGFSSSMAGYAFDRARGIHYLAIAPKWSCDVCVEGGGAIWRVAADGSLAEFAGETGAIGNADGQGTAARFGRSLVGPVLDAAGNLYVVDDNGVRKITPGGVVSTVAPQVISAEGGWIHAAGMGLAADAAGNVYMLGMDHVLRKVTPQGQVSVLAGAPGPAAHADGVGAAARFGDAFSGYQMATDPAGNIYVGEQGACNALTSTGVVCAGAIRKVAPDGTVTTIAGSLDKTAIVLGPLPGRLYAPASLLWTPGGLVVGSGWSLLKIR